jgi:monofunctional biosynthetic peptidoglycan transglycosylase
MFMRRVGRAIAAVAAFGFGYLAFLYLSLPDVRELRTKNPETTAFMRLRAREARREGRDLPHVHDPVPYSRISPHLKRAVLVAEDAGFWGHEGIDLEEIKKSLEADWEAGALTRGASTITQQLAKNLYLSPSRIPTRKLSELYITRRLEFELSKTRIFELYLNNIEWGDGIWGAEAAARTYFGIPASAIGPDQAALMAGAIVNPRVLNIAKPNGRLRARQRIIRARMGYVTPPPVVAVPPPAESTTSEETAPVDNPDAASEPAEPAEPQPVPEPPPATTQPEETQPARPEPRTPNLEPEPGTRNGEPASAPPR